jgi:hypothetical protein
MLFCTRQASWQPRQRSPHDRDSALLSTSAFSGAFEAPKAVGVEFIAENGGGAGVTRSDEIMVARDDRHAEPKPYPPYLQGPTGLYSQAPHAILVPSRTFDDCFGQGERHA